MVLGEHRLDVCDLVSCYWKDNQWNVGSDSFVGMTFPTCFAYFLLRATVVRRSVLQLLTSHGFFFFFF